MTRVAATVLAMTIAASAADAADLRGTPSYYTAAAPLTAYAWTGPYLGANLAYQWGYTTNNPTRPSGLAGGVQAGYNFQTGRFVFGGEADVTLSATSDTFAPWKFSNPWFGTARVRAGVAVNHLLFYGTVGFALGELRAQVGGLSESKTLTGWTAGGGVEAALTRNWSARLEYLYVDLGDRNYLLTNAPNGIESHLVRVGLNYRF